MKCLKKRKLGECRRKVVEVSCASVEWGGLSVLTHYYDKLIVLRTSEVPLKFVESRIFMVIPRVWRETRLLPSPSRKLNISECKPRARACPRLVTPFPLDALRPSAPTPLHHPPLHPTSHHVFVSATLLPNVPFRAQLTTHTSSLPPPPQ